MLYRANGESIQAEVVGTSYLSVSTGKTIVLRGCYYMSNIIRNIISVSMLLKLGYEIKVKSNSFSIFLSNEFIRNAYMDNDLFILLVNDNIFMMDKNKKRKRENDNITSLKLPTWSH